MSTKFLLGLSGLMVVWALAEPAAEAWHAIAVDSNAAPELQYIGNDTWRPLSYVGDL